MAISGEYIESVRDLLDFVPELSIKKMFGAATALTGGLAFALLDDDQLWLKADAQSRSRFESSGLQQFTYPGRDGRLMPMAYWLAPAEIWEDPDAARAWIREAIDAAFRAKAAKPKRKPKAS